MQKAHPRTKGKGGNCWSGEEGILTISIYVYVDSLSAARRLYYMQLFQAEWKGSH